VVFVEVKCRRGLSGIEQAVGPRKIRALLRSARSFLQWSGLEAESYRFMVIYVILERNGCGAPSVECVEDPF